MKDFFAGLYEWWGLNPLFAMDLADHLRGYDITCTDYIATPWYTVIGFSMLGVTILFYVLQYHIIDSTKFNKTIHWFFMALLIVIINFVIAFSIPYNSLQTENYCNQLHFSSFDCMGFGFSNALWALIVFSIITGLPWMRGRSVNCRHTTPFKR